MDTRQNIPLPPPTRGGKPGKRKPKVPAVLRAAADAYKQAYKAVYGIPPTLRWDGKWIRITGQSQGVSLSRLKAMTTQLKLRAG